MKRTRRWLAGLLCAALLACLLPTAALAADGHWADGVVAALNGIYGSDVFTASNDAMTVKNARDILAAMKTSSAKLTGEGTAPFTRGTACEVLVDIFYIPTGEKSAIEYLYEQNIINGNDSGDLDADSAVTEAQFAVLTYRVLNFVGGGMTSGDAVLKPGTKEYFSWMYLAVRKCVAFNSQKINATIGSATNFMTYDSTTVTDYTDGTIVCKVNTEEKSGNEIWNAWAAALSDTNIGGIEKFNESLTITYDGFETMLAAATRLMDAFREAYAAANDGEDLTIFLDVTPDDWWYDGVMYSFDAGYINGLGNGTFEPEIRTPLYEFAVLLYRIDPTEVDLTGINDVRIPEDATESEKNTLSNPSVQKAMKTAIAKGYLSWADWDKEDFDPRATVTRQDAIADILKACGAGKGVDLQLDSVNTEILERFTDTGSIKPAAKPYLAYAVSHGMVSGTAGTSLLPTEPVMRAQAGVLLYRTLIGLDTTKMKDYEENVEYAKGETQIQTFALRAVRSSGNVLTLREDWRLTSDLDLAVAEGETLTIVGNGYHIYEMGGRLLNSGLGTVTFAENTILYPAANDADAANVTSSGIWDAEESNILMLVRQPHTVTTTVTNPDGSTTTTITNQTTGTVIEATKNTDGSTLVVVTEKDGTVTSTQTTVEKVVIKTVDEPGEDVTATVTIPGSVGAATVTIPADVTPGSVAVNAKTGEVIKLSVPAEGGLAVKLDGSAELVLMNNAKELTDTEDHWAENAIDFVTAREIFAGTSETTFDPNSTMTRAMLMTVLARFDGVDTSGSSVWYEKGMEWAMTNGVSDGSNPNGNITREQLATMLWRYSGSPVAESGMERFPDAGQVSGYAADAMRWAVETGLIGGMDDGTLNPQGNATRAQLATILMRYCGNLVK